MGSSYNQESTLRKLNCPKHILVFTKYPVPGFAKTRLIPSEGPEGAATISRQLTERCVTTVRNFLTQSTRTQDVASLIYFTGKQSVDVDTMKAWLGPLETQPPQGRESFHRQGTGDLGQRMASAFSSSFDAGAEKVLIIGTDIPEINGDILHEAFLLLDQSDLVIGPAADGGYYLLAMKKLYPSLFANIEWSTSQVCSSTLRAADALNLRTSKLKILRDVDLPEDVEFLRSVLGKKIV